MTNDTNRQNGNDLAGKNGGGMALTVPVVELEKLVRLTAFNTSALAAHVSAWANEILATPPSAPSPTSEHEKRDAKYASRYRWLRATNGHAFVGFNERPGFKPCGSLLDDYIDAYMEAPTQPDESRQASAPSPTVAGLTDEQVNELCASVGLMTRHKLPSGKNPYWAEELSASEMRDAVRKLLALSTPSDSAETRMTEPGEYFPRVEADSPVWRPINTAPWSDDLIWVCKGDVIGGPKRIQHDDADEWDYWTPCVAPVFNAAPAATRASEKDDD
ncbi:hypothetical protein [Cupriavidus sp. D384]|uniref:hypothetical protein n=1 Tax=Cupriavidus sp. D384 TaxID=1538095 RepID=UPI0008370674|nr:hypothetical protein [Cupriavidus sp. D384]